MERRQIWLTSRRQSDAVSWMTAWVTCDAQSARQTEEVTVSKTRQENLSACSRLALTMISFYLTWWHKESSVTALGSASCHVSNGIRCLTLCNHDRLWFRARSWTFDQSDRLKGIYGMMWLHQLSSVYMKRRIQLPSALFIVICLFFHHLCMIWHRGTPNNEPLYWEWIRIHHHAASTQEWSLPLFKNGLTSLSLWHITELCWTPWQRV